MNQKKVFICDDDRGITNMLEMILEFEGIATMIERDSAQAYLKIVDYKPDILIVDLWMPIVSGDLLIRKLRSDPNLNKIHIICISASSDGESVAKNAGADVFISKPFDVDEFLKAVDDAVKTVPEKS